MAINKVIITAEKVDESTGEITTNEIDITDIIVKAVNKKPVVRKRTATGASKSKILENDTPILKLEENKYILSTGAVEALGANLGDDRIVIRFQKIGDSTVPVIGTNTTFGIKSGNRLTLVGSVSCRGKANEELSEYGNEFILVAHPSAEGMYVLTSDGVLPEGDYSTKTRSTTNVETTPSVKVPQPEPEDTSDLDELDALLSDSDAVEVDGDDFEL